MLVAPELHAVPAHLSCGRSEPAAAGRSCSLVDQGDGCILVVTAFGPPSRLVNSFQLNKGIALVGFESLLCCAAWDKCSDLRSRLGCCC